MKKCPMCAEEIQDEAIKCKHCGSKIPLERLNQIKLDKANDVMSAISYISKPVLSGIAGIMLIVGAIGGCARLGVVDVTVISLYDKYGLIAIFPAAIAFVQVFFGIMEGKIKTIITGIIGFTVAVCLGFYLIYLIQSNGFASSTEVHWGAWVFGIGSLILLFPLSDWKAEAEAGVTKN